MSQCLMRTTAKPVTLQPHAPTFLRHQHQSELPAPVVVGVANQELTYCRVPCAPSEEPPRATLGPIAQCCCLGPNRLCLMTSKVAHFSGLNIRARNQVSVPHILAAVQSRCALVTGAHKPGLTPSSPSRQLFARRGSGMTICKSTNRSQSSIHHRKAVVLETQGCQRLKCLPLSCRLIAYQTIHTERRRHVLTVLLIILQLTVLGDVSPLSAYLGQKTVHAASVLLRHPVISILCAQSAETFGLVSSFLSHSW